MGFFSGLLFVVVFTLGLIGVSLFLSSKKNKSSKRQIVQTQDIKFSDNSNEGEIEQIKNKKISNKPKSGLYDINGFINELIYIKSNITTIEGMETSGYLEIDILDGDRWSLEKSQFDLQIELLFNIRERIEYLYFYCKFNQNSKIEIDSINNLINLYLSISKSLGYMCIFRLGETEILDFDEYENFNNECNISLKNINCIENSDDKEILNQFIRKYSDTDFSGSVINKLQELLEAKGYVISEDVLINYCFNKSDELEVEKVINEFNSKELNDLDGAIDYYIEIDPEEINLNNKNALIRFVELHINNELDYKELDILIAKKKKNLRIKRFEENLNSENTPPVDIDQFSGYEFEEFLSKLYTKMGYKVEETKLTGDQGADLIIEKHGTKTVVQAKRYTGSVGNSSVQEIVAAKNHFNADKAIVITNSYFTKSAKELAESNTVELIDRERLNTMIDDFM